MLKTNSKIVRDRIRKMIIESVVNYVECERKYIDARYQSITAESPFEEIANFVIVTFQAEKLNLDLRYKARRISKYDIFEDWQQGLNSVLPNNYYLESAIDILGDILEQSAEKRNQYTEAQAEQTLTRLIFREIDNATTINY